jgi:hypothetical protein
LIVGLEWKQVQKETEGQAKFGNSSFTVKKSENLAQHESTPGVIRHASDSCLTEETWVMDGETGLAARLMLGANVFAVVVEMPLLLAFDLI